jgi:ferric-dicitrate binding protein FerR (iron transport regulator)
MNENDVERVLRAAGPRGRPPEDVELKAREYLRNEWHSVVAEQRTRRQRRMSIALAAGLAVAAIGAWLAGPLVTGPGEAIATIALASGEIHAKTGWLGSWRAIGNGESVAAGEALMTGTAGGVAVALPGGVSARLDRDTRITLASAERVLIESGALYVDAGRAPEGSARLEVVTPTGSLRHVGTQYEVRLLGSQVRVRVREGHVEWSNGTGAAASGAAGEQLTIEPGGFVQRDATPNFGESWDWVAATTPGIDIDGQPLADILAWAGRELGREIVFATADIETESTRIVVHGSIAGLTPMQALDAVLATTRFQAVVDNGRIVIGLQEPGRQPSVTSSSANPAT